MTECSAAAAPPSGVSVLNLLLGVVGAEGELGDCQEEQWKKRLIFSTHR